MKFPKLINWDLASHPLNWVVILLMLTIAGAIGHYALTLAGVEPSTSTGKKGKNAYGSLPAGQTPASDSIAAINPATAGLVS